MKAQKVVSVILALTLMMSMVPAAFAVELENPNDIFSEEYFAYVAKEDGNPYDVDEDISVAYQSDPVQFMNQLGKIDPMYKDFYIRTLVSVAYNEFDWEGFKSQILSLSVEDSSVINQLYAYAIQFEEEEHAWEEYYKDWKNRPQAEGRFNPDIVLEAITSHAEAYTFDMEYCDYLRAMHQLDPNLFIRTISDLSKEEIQLIATQIRYAQKNKRSINTSNIAGNSTVDGIRLSDENLNEEETRKFLDNAFRDGQVKTNGTDIEKILPPMRRFGGGNRAEKKENIIVKVKKFFEKYFGLGTADKNDDGFEYRGTDEEENYDLNMVAEEGEEYKLKE